MHLGAFPFVVRLKRFSKAGVFFFGAQCAASMDVGVGHYSDPPGIEGLAHFLGTYCFSVSFLK